MSKRASSEEMEYNDSVVRKSSTSTANNNSSGYGKSLAQQQTMKITTGTSNAERIQKGCTI